MSDPNQPPGSPPPTGPPPGGQPPGGPPPPGAWGPQYAQPAAQPYVGGYHGPDWIPEIGRQLGSAGTRIGAKAIDIVIIIAVQVAISLVAVAVSSDDLLSTSNSFSLTTNWLQAFVFGLLALFIDFLYNVVLVARSGGQPGKLMLGLRIVRTDGSDVDLRTASIRWSPILALSVLGFVPIAGIFASIGRFILLVVNLVLVLSDPRRQSVFDKVAGTYVVGNR